MLLLLVEFLRLLTRLILVFPVLLFLSCILIESEIAAARLFGCHFLFGFPLFISFLLLMVPVLLYALIVIFKLFLNIFQIIFRFFGNGGPFSFAHEPFLLWSAFNICFILDKIFTALDLSNGFFHFSFLLHVSLDLLEGSVQLSKDMLVYWFYQFVLDCEGVDVLAELAT